MAIERTRILVLNHNGAALLRECLPSIARAADQAGVPCPITVVDNASTDESLAYLAKHWPQISLLRCENRGLASFNTVLAQLEEPAVLLLNNDVKLQPDALPPLLSALANDQSALFAAPQCWTFDGSTYEGMRTRVRMRFGMVQGLCRVPGFEQFIHQTGLTASAGPVLLVDRAKFLAIGGYDPLYLPGRIEDLDLGFAGWLRGWRGLYVPESRAFHKGFGSFEPAFGRSGCDRLALRNTLLFAWKNLRGARLLAHLAWLPLRAAWSLVARRPTFLFALIAALRRLPLALHSRRAVALAAIHWKARQDSFFQQFQW